MSIYKHKSGYRLDFRVNAPTRGEKSVRITRLYPTKAEAEHASKFLHTQLARARARGRTLPNQKITLAEALSDWLKESHELTAKNGKHRYLAKDCHREVSRRKKWMESHLGGCRFVDLSFSHIESFVETQRDNDRAESTIRNDLQVINRLYKYATSRWRWEMSNPIPEILKDVGTSGHRDRRLSSTEHERLIRLFEQLEHEQKQYDSKQRQRIRITTDTGRSIDMQSHPSLLDMKVAFLAAIECAMRRGKMFEMRWSWIDWKSKDIVIPSQLQGPRNKGVPSRVPMSPRLYNVLKTHRGPRQIGMALDAPVFGRLTADRAYRLLKLACKALDIHDFRWHDLRHEACSRLAERGWTAPQIQAVSGHKTLQSLQRYVHVSTAAVHRLFERDEREGRTGTHI